VDSSIVNREIKPTVRPACWGERKCTSRSAVATHREAKHGCAREEPNTSEKLLQAPTSLEKPLLIGHAACGNEVVFTESVRHLQNLALYGPAPKTKRKH